MTEPLPHICVCVCTFKRPALLKELLEALGVQQTAQQFTYSAVVVDNDVNESARATVESAAQRLTYPITYAVEPEQNIAMARNCAVARAQGDYLAFIDDDECPAPDWLALMRNACESCGTSGVLAPVRPRFERQPPKWMIRTGFFDRPEYPTGTLLPWRETRTGNAIVRRNAIAELVPPFRAMYGAGGEDQDFFRRLIERGHQFAWCNEAAVYELVPVARAKVSYMCRRALLRGLNEQNSLGVGSIVKSMVAASLYIVALPVLLLLGRHLFIRYVAKLCDHAGKLAAAAGYRPKDKKYVSS